MKCSELGKMLKRDGWYTHSQSGSHKKMKHPTKKEVIIFPDHGSKEMASGTAHSILKAAGLKK